MDIGDTKAIDSAVKLRGEDGQFDAATYVASAVFNAAAFPPNMPEYLRRHIEAEAAFAQRLDDAGVTIGGANGGPVGEMTKAERLKKANDEAAEYIDVMFEKLERDEREREEWMRATSTVAGVSMTGAEWAKLAERLRSDEGLHRKLIEIFRARGMSESEAEARYDRVADIAEIAAMPPNQRTDAQRETMKSAEADPTFKRDIADMQRAANDRIAPTSDLNQAFSSARDGPTPVADKPAPSVDQTVKLPTQVVGMGM